MKVMLINANSNALKPKSKLPFAKKIPAVESGGTNAVAIPTPTITPLYRLKSSEIAPAIPPKKAIKKSKTPGSVLANILSVASMRGKKCPYKNAIVTTSRTPTESVLSPSKMPLVFKLVNASAVPATGESKVAISIEPIITAVLLAISPEQATMVAIPLIIKKEISSFALSIIVLVTSSLFSFFKSIYLVYLLVVGLCSLTLKTKIHYRSNLRF